MFRSAPCRRRRALRNRAVALTASTGILATLLGAPLAVAADTAVVPPQESVGSAIARPNQLETATAAASERARRTGARVQIAEADTETSTTYANPDGTFLLDAYAGPIRVLKPDGWRPVDPSLTFVDGRVRPRVAKAAIGFSAGGPAGGPLATFGDGAKQVTLRWPTSLPAPTLDGDTATYDNVLPGADLQLVATPVSFAIHLVLKKRPAAALALKMPLSRSAGQTLLAHEAGEGDLLASDGSVAAKISRSFMWDADNDPKKKGPDGRRPVDQVLTDGGDLQLRPDPAFLANPKTRYPVTIDPSVQLPDNLDTGVTSYAPNSNYDADNTLWVGRSGYGTLYRSYIRFNDSAIKGKHVTDANLGLFQTGHGNTCSPMPLYVQGVAGMGPGTTWNTQPSRDGINWGNKSFNAGADCPNSGSTLVGIPITGLVDAWSKNGYPSPEALALIAPNENDNAYWKMFASSETQFKPHIQVTYNSYPSAPTGLTAGPCLGTCDDPAQVSSLTPSLTATATDPEGAALRYDFEVWTGDDSSQPTARVVTGSFGPVSGNSTATWMVPAGSLQNDKPYAFRVRAYDGIDYGPWSSGWVSFSAAQPILGAPSAVSSRLSQDSTLLSLDWQPPDISRGLTVTGYTITVQPAGKQFEVDANARALDLSGVDVSTAQEVTIAAKDFQGSGNQASVKFDPANPDPTLGNSSELATDSEACEANAPANPDADWICAGPVLSAETPDATGSTRHLFTDVRTGNSVDVTGASEDQQVQALDDLVVTGGQDEPETQPIPGGCTSTAPCQRVDDYRAKSNEYVNWYINGHHGRIRFSYSINVAWRSADLTMGYWETTGQAVKLTWRLRIRHNIKFGRDSTVYTYPHVYGPNYYTRGYTTYESRYGAGWNRLPGQTGWKLFWDSYNMSLIAYGSRVGVIWSVQSDQVTCYKTVSCKFK